MTNPLFHRQAFYLQAVLYNASDGSTTLYGAEDPAEVKNNNMTSLTSSESLRHTIRNAVYTLSGWRGAACARYSTERRLSITETDKFSEMAESGLPQSVDRVQVARGPAGHFRRGFLSASSIGGGAPSPLCRVDLIVALILAGVLLVLGYWKLVPGVTGVYHDDAIYVITGKALAQGDGYRLINLPGAPPQTKYPILYPLLLAAVWKVQPAFPDAVVLMQYLTLMLGAAAVGLSYLYLVRFGYCSRIAAGCVGLLCATSPQIVYYSTLTMSEMPFLLIAVLALWRAEIAMVERQVPGQALLTGCLLAMPFLCRSVGVAFLFGAFAAFIRRRCRMKWILFGAAVPV
ncbi:MAG TPA: hypothetical protein VLL97_11140, partial [Acidobacteriota bacterium]|nr:hypothetical protein [Acidobacteriota bacterium]